VSAPAFSCAVKIPGYANGVRYCQACCDYPLSVHYIRTQILENDGGRFGAKLGPAEERTALLGRDSHNAVAAVGDEHSGAAGVSGARIVISTPTFSSAWMKRWSANLHATRRNLAGQNVFADHGDVYACPSTR
jgi:hypothetical protein